MEVVEACVSKAGWFLRTVERTGHDVVNLPLEYKSRRYDRLDNMRNALLAYTNANLGTCGYFEPPIDSDQKMYRAFRISLDLWDDPSLIDGFIRAFGQDYPDNDLDVMRSWKETLSGPMFCMETYGDKALFMCDGYVFEAVSYGRQWDDMIPYTPDLVITSLLPFEGEIALGGFTTKHFSPLNGPGLMRINAEYREALDRGIIDDARRFCEASGKIRADRKKHGIEINAWSVYMECIDWINDMTEDSCFPYEATLRIRDEEF
ncbi:MAG: hypothetical protein J6D25_06105 [Eggerthellaceae bacterium]|nr:hypothetical protein [Eggerthellaceae bacterium]